MEKQIDKSWIILLAAASFVFAAYTLIPIGYKFYKKTVETTVETVVSIEDNKEVFTKKAVASDTLLERVKNEKEKVFLYKNLLLLEFPVFLFVTFFLFFSKIKSKFIKYAFPLIPSITIYIIFDIFYLFLQRIPRPSDFKNIHTFFDFSLLLTGAVLSLAAASAIYLFIFIINICKIKNVLRVITLKIFFCAIAWILISFSMKNDFYSKVFDYVEWSEGRTVQLNGRFSSFIYYMITESKNKKKLKEAKFKNNIDIEKILYKESNLHDRDRRNVHIIILESFLDPRLIDEIQFHPYPLSRELVPFLLEGDKFSLVQSSIYGGGSAQSEFELLTGIKALAKIITIEFNLMQGNPAMSFARKLQKYNYESIGTIASSSVSFNVKLAYKSLGVNNVVFMKDEFKYEGDDMKPVFDGDLFEYNIKRIEPYIKSKQPIFNYVVGMYGHYPYGENVHNFIEVKHENSDVRKISNQFFLRTKALGQYLNKLKTIDPNSIICVVSDHLPAVLDGKTRYKFDKHVNVALFIDSGRVIDISGKKYFEIPPMIWEILSGDKNSFYIDDKTMEKMYFKFLSETIL